jgi:hypothetical protein
LTNLTKKSHVWDWTGKCQEAFEKLKQLLIEAPLLRTPDGSKTYRVVTDASDIGLGGVFLLEGHPIAYESRKLNSAEQNYTTTEWEMLAIVHALRVWRCYLEGVYFEVETDHKCNTFFQSQPNLELTAPSTLVGIPTALWQVPLGLLPWRAECCGCVK